jgi:hypothetical protein
VTRFLAVFNWKTALLSAFWRALLFFALTARHGLAAATQAFLLETGFRILASGLYGALTQQLSLLQPPWLSAALCVAVLPALIQLAEYLLHRAAHTPNLAAATLASTVFAALSAIFHWYVMRRGALTSGPGAATLLHDLRRMPALVRDFLLAGPRALRRLLSLP